nr:hypothetical protein [Snodgrassella sp. ESL0253]
MIADRLFDIVLSSGNVALLTDVAGCIVLILYAIAIGLFLFYQLVGIVVAVFNIIAQCFGFNENNFLTLQQTKSVYN